MVANIPSVHPVSRSNAQKSDSVDATSLAYDEMLPTWNLCTALRSNTGGMRRAALHETLDGLTRYLPKEDKETDREFWARLHRTYLFPAYDDTIGKLVAKPFSQQVTVTDEDRLPDFVAPIMSDADREGTSFHDYLRECFDIGVDRGMHHVLVDFPTDAAGMSLGEQIENNVHPYFVHIRPTDLIGWRTERTPTGGRHLRSIRVKSTRVEPLGTFGEQRVKLVKVYVFVTEAEFAAGARGTVQVFRQAEGDDDFTPESEPIQHTYSGVPLESYYTDAEHGFLTASPPLEDIAWLNLKHFQSGSQQDNILHYARVPILARAGVSTASDSEPLVLGVQRVLNFTNPDGKAFWVEHSGRAIEAGEKDLKRTEERMEILGVQPLMQRTGGETATGRAMDQAAQTSEIQSWVRSLEIFALSLLKKAARWVGAEIDERVSVQLYNDFAISLRASEDIRALIEMRKDNEIPREEFLREMRRRAVISQDSDIDDMARRLDEDDEERAMLIPRFDESDDPRSREADSDAA